jgi:putative ABC transport system permease protein
MFFNLFRYFSLRYLLMHKLRTVLTFLGVALGISLFLSILLLNDATFRSIDDNIDAMTGKAHLTITSDGMGFEESVLEKVKNHSEIKAAIPVIINYAYLNEKDSDAILFLGIDMLKDSSVREYNTTGAEIIPDPLAFINQADSIVATNTWAARQGLEMDSEIELLTKEGKKIFTIRGLIDEMGPAKAVNGNLIIMDIDGARYNFGRDGLYDRIDILLHDPQKIEDVRRELKQVLGERFKVQDRFEQSESMQQIVQSVKDVSGMLGIISFMVGFLIIVNTVNTAISQRKKDIGSLRAFGASKSHIIILFAGEFIFLSLLSSLFGAWLGYHTALQSTQQMAQGLNASLMANVTNMKVVFTWEHLVAALFLGLLSSVCALVYPLMQALRIHPIEAIKPQSMDFGLSRKPKAMVWAAIVGGSFFLFTLIGGEISHFYPSLQTQEFQSIFLFTGICCIIMMAPYLVLTLISLMELLPLPFLIKFSLGNLLKNPSRTASTSVHLSLGFSLVILVSFINISFKETILNWVDRIMNASHVVNITSWGSISGLQVQPMHESMREKLLALPHVKKSHPNPIMGVRVVTLTLDGKRFIIKAFDDPQDGERYHFIDPIEGSKKQLGDALFNQERPTLLMSETMLAHFKKKVGEEFVIETPTGRVSFLIGGNIREFASPAGVIYLNREVYKKLWQDPLVTLFSLFHEESFNSEEYREIINPHLSEQYNLVANLPRKLYNEVATNLDNNMALSESTKWVALFIGSLGLLNSFLIAILQRFRELGCIRSIGMTRGQLLGMILVESASLGVIGVIVAFLTTLPISYIWVNYTLTYLLGWKVEFTFTGADFLVYFVVGIIVSVLAGLIPAVKASKLKLSEALQYE